MSCNRIPELVENLQVLNNHHLEIGILSGQGAEDAHGDGEFTIVGIAAVHEFGVTIQRVGKDATHLITIPERSYMRAGWDSKQADIDKKVQYYLGQVIDGKIDAYTFFNIIGEQVSSYLQEYLVALSAPPLAQSTIDRKGSSNPLVDTGRLGDSITFKVV